jgi:hypothetical protein
MTDDTYTDGTEQIQEYIDKVEKEVVRHENEGNERCAVYSKGKLEGLKIAYGEIYRRELETDT